MLDRIKIAKDKRRNNRDNFRMENGYSWDYVLVFRVYDCLDELSEDQKKFSFKYVVNRLAEGGLQTRLFYSMDVSQINVLNSFMACITSSFIGLWSLLQDTLSFTEAVAASCANQYEIRIRWNIFTSSLLGRTKGTASGIHSSTAIRLSIRLMEIFLTISNQIIMWKGSWSLICGGLHRFTF